MFIRLKGINGSGIIVNLDKVIGMVRVDNDSMTKIRIKGNHFTFNTPETIDEIEEKIYRATTIV